MQLFLSTNFAITVVFVPEPSFNVALNSSALTKPDTNFMLLADSSLVLTFSSFN
jgi:hypothetical protein